MTDPTADAAKLLPNYVGMTEPQMLAAVGDDASKWADAFCQIARRGGIEIDPAWMTGWFANAIEHSTQVRNTRPQPAPPESEPDLRRFIKIKPVVVEGEL